uniref:Glutaredoxin domain-containing protein n=1 Tax=Syphacia muris TaxID=451379 RepID=A0A0N5ASV5_9BILA
MNDEFRGCVILYSSSDSEDSRKAQEGLTALNIPFINICLDIFPQCQKEMEQHSGSTDVPQIFFNEVCIGGLEGLQQLANDENRLDALMEMLRTTEPPINAPSLPEPEVTSEKHDDFDSVVDVESHDEDADKDKNEVENEYTVLINSMRKANVIKDNLTGSKKLCRNSFKGEDFIRWIMKEKQLSRDDAIELGQKLVSQRSKLRWLKESFDPNRFYELYELDNMKPLNQGPTTSDQLSADEMNEILVSLLEPLYQQILSCNGRIVNYAELGNNTYFQQYMLRYTDLQRVKITEDTPDNLKTALFLNIYNIMLIHIHYKFGHPSNIWQRRKLMWTTYYSIDNKLYSLHSILNGILRGNRKNYEMLWKPFGKTDFRRKLIVKNPNPSVLFAVTTSSRSTNPIRVYSTKQAAQEALESDEFLMIDNVKKTVALSAIFDWYAIDFGLTQDNTVKWIIQNMKDGVKRDNLIRLYEAKGYKVDYLDFDWTPNIKKP